MSLASVEVVVVVATITGWAGTVFVFREFPWNRTVWSVWNVLLITSGLRHLLGWGLQARMIEEIRIKVWCCAEV